MKAQYWTAIGVMLIPVGVAVLLGSHLNTLAFLLMGLGFVFSIAGWVYTIRYENQLLTESKARADKNRSDESSRKLEYRENIIVLRAIAKAHGVKMWRIDMLMRKWMEKEGLLDEWGRLREEKDDDND